MPGGFGDRGTRGKIAAINYTRLHSIPVLGICLGFQLMLVEAARNQLGWTDANSTEMDEATSHLDLGNERAVTAAIAHMQLTRLIIAHRPETIAGAQRVVQILPTQLGGQVVELARVVPAEASA